MKWSLSYIDYSQFEILHEYMIWSVATLDFPIYGFFDSLHSGFI